MGFPALARMLDCCLHWSGHVCAGRQLRERMAERLVAAAVPELLQKHRAMKKSAEVARPNAEASLDRGERSGEIAAGAPDCGKLQPQ